MLRRPGRPRPSLPLVSLSCLRRLGAGPFVLSHARPVHTSKVREARLAPNARTVAPVGARPSDFASCGQQETFLLRLRRWWVSVGLCPHFPPPFSCVTGHPVSSTLLDRLLVVAGGEMLFHLSVPGTYRLSVIALHTLAARAALVAPAVLCSCARPSWCCVGLPSAPVFCACFCGTASAVRGMGCAPRLFPWCLNSRMTRWRAWCGLRVSTTLFRAHRRARDYGLSPRHGIS